MAERVPTNNERGRRSGPCRLCGGLDKARHIVSTALLVRVQCFRKGLYKDDIILNITNQVHLIFMSLHIDSRLFKLFSKEVRVKKQPGMPLSDRDQSLHSSPLNGQRASGKRANSF